MKFSAPASEVAISVNIHEAEHQSQSLALLLTMGHARTFENHHFGWDRHSIPLRELSV